jgi:hypothetical protein
MSDLTLLDYNSDIHVWLPFFIGLNVRFEREISKEDLSDISFGLVKTSDGLIYYFEEIYIFTNFDNKADEIFINNPNKVGLSVIKNGSNLNSKVIMELSQFLLKLHKFVFKAVKNKSIFLQVYEQWSANDFKETLIKKYKTKV